MNWKRYIYTFIITLIIFTFSLWLSNRFNDEKINTLRDIGSQISLDILSAETRFSLLQKTSCEHIIDQASSTIGFNTELQDLAARIKFMENQLGYQNPDVVALKKNYTLLQIKDYLLNKEYHDRCKQDVVSILYFHGLDCKACSDQSIILDKIISDYPEIRVYYFDINTNTPALATLSSVFKVTSTPSLVINDKIHPGFQSVAKVESYIPEIKQWKKDKIKAPVAASTTSTTSKKK
ncbi:MAG: hypothetical protein RJB39_97 [Candidatus Parcubacteria bacterium]|jgi:hypothetical protein